MGGSVPRVARCQSRAIAAASSVDVLPEAMMMDLSPSDGWLNTYDSAVFGAKATRVFQEGAGVWEGVREGSLMVAPCLRPSSIFERWKTII
jgi:hypothetical protein